MAKRLTKAAACDILRDLGIPRDANVYTLRWSQLTDLAAAARRVGYRKPKNANASRGTYFHSYLQRLCR